MTGLSDALKGQRTVPLPAGWVQVETKLAVSTNATIRSRAQSLSLTVLAVVLGRSVNEVL